MAFSRLVFSVLLLSVSCYATQVPAFIWGDVAKPSIKANPFVTITPGEFMSILHENLSDDKITVVFTDENLSVEDFSTRNAEGETSFPFLHSKLGNSVYLPSVEAPVPTLAEFAASYNVKHVSLTDSLSAEIEPGTAKFLFIELKDAKEGESRQELLRRHNDFIEDMFTKLSKSKENVVAIYTAHFPSWIIPSEDHLRVRRQASNGTDDGNDYQLDGLRLYVKDILIIDGNNTVSVSGNVNAQTVFNDTDKTMNTSLTFGDYSFVLNFKSKMGYWYFESITFNGEDLQPNLEVYALEDWSYRCAQSVLFNSANVSRALKFEDLQVQPYFRSNNESLVFGETVDCIGYFSAPIWAGLMVTFLLLAITFYGMMMIMDIRTMDRFDDPKGKTITINAAE